MDRAKRAEEQWADEPTAAAPGRTRWLLGVLVAPWLTPVVMRWLDGDDEGLRLLSFLLWPIVYFFVGMYLAARREPNIAPLAGTEHFAPAADAVARYSRWAHLAAFILFLFHAGIAALLLNDRAPVEPIIFCTIAFYFPYLLLAFHSEMWLVRAQQIVAQALPADHLQADREEDYGSGFSEEWAA